MGRAGKSDVALKREVLIHLIIAVSGASRFEFPIFSSAMGKNTAEPSSRKGIEGI
jgi:hypothetical protein